MDAIGIDVGGTKTAGVVLDAGWNVLFSDRVPTQADMGYDRVLENVAAVHSRLAGLAGGRAGAVGVCVPGGVGPGGGQVTRNPACLQGRPLKRDLEQRLGTGVAMENDANCFALAEALCGAARGKRLVFGATLGTGCGGGIVLEGRLVKGLQGRAGEWGHMTLDPAGPPCSCGLRGCAQALVSGRGAERLYEERFGRRKSLAEIEEAARGNDPGAAGFMREFIANFGRAMANVAAVLDPDIIVLGGGVANLDVLYTDGARALAAATVPYARPPPLVKTALGESSGAIGAALVALVHGNAVSERPA
jgi:fructokinase